VYLHTVLFKIRKSTRSSKRFRGLFRTFEVLFAFWPREILGQFSSTQKLPKSEKCFKGVDKPKETLATQVKNKTNPEMSF